MKRYSPCRRRCHPHGFTLVEIVLVLAIISLLLGVAVKSLVNVLDRGKEVRTAADLDAFNSALTMYQSKALRYPTTEQGLKALVQPPSPPVPGQWSKTMDAINPDPWGHDYYYYYPGKKNGPAKPDIGSCGPDGIEGNEDDIGNWSV
jgi:general secretion pathway protein G